MSINWGGIGDWFTGGLTDFDQQGNDIRWGQPGGPLFGGSDGKWGPSAPAVGAVPSIGTQVGAYPGSVDWLQDYANKTFGASGTQQVGASTPGKSFSFSNATAPSGSSFVSSDYGSGGGGNRIGSWYMDEGSGPMFAEAVIRQKYTPLQRTWHNESYGPGGSGGGGGSSTGDAIKGLAGKAIGLVGDKILGSLNV